jgi:hypothetical protein
VTASLDRSEAVPRLDLLRRCSKIRHRDQYVVEFQGASSKVVNPSGRYFDLRAEASG